MDAAPSGGGGPAPFLVKTYEMVDDSATDEIVSWSSAQNSFVVWNPPEFARLLLPTYFKHNNFSSFIRQLNTYGFRKIDPERWEFANEEFMKDQKHLLKNIHRRKPIHSHSNPPGSMVDPERAAFEEDIERLSREKASLEAHVLSFRQQRSAEKLQLDDMMERVGGMERRQENLLTFLQKAVNNPSFAEHLAQKIESMDFSAYNKKRRLPQVDQAQPAAVNSIADDLSTSKPRLGNIFHQDFSSKLRLELSPTVSDINVVSHSNQSSSGGGGHPKYAGLRESIFHTAGTSELLDTGTSFTFIMDSSLLRKEPANDPPRLHVLQQGLPSTEEGDGHMSSCQLNLTLASSSLQVSRSPYSSKAAPVGQELSRSSDSKFSTDSIGASGKIRLPAEEDATLSSSQMSPNNNQGSAAPPVRVNDVFWEQFLTEKPGSSDNEEASSNYRENPYEEQETRSIRNMERLTL